MIKIKLIIGLFLLGACLDVLAISEPCKKKINEKDYLFKGSEETTTAADKLYNFEKLRKDLKDQLMNSERLDEKKAMCLNELYKQGINGASKYWADRGQKEGCFTETKVPKSRPEDCPEATWKEFKKSRNYIQKLQEDLRKDLRPLASAAPKGGDIVAPTCRPQAPNKYPEQDMLKVAEQARTNLCCGSQNDKEGAVRAVYPELNFNQCMAKISETSEEMVSVKGLAMCSANIVSEAIKTIWDSVKSLFSLPSEIIGIMSSVKELVTNAEAREQFVDNLKKSVHEFLSSRGVTFNQCLNKYEQSMYICEVTGNVVGGFVDIGAIGKVIKALRYGKAASEIGGMLSKSPKGQSVLNGLKKAEDFTLSAAGKAKAGAKAAADKVVQSLARDPRAYNVASQIMAKDVSFDLQVNSEIKKASKIKAEAAKTEAKKTGPKTSDTKSTTVKDDEVIMSYTNDKGDKFELLGPEKKAATEIGEALPPKKISGSEPVAQLEYKAAADAPAPTSISETAKLEAPKAEVPNYAAKRPTRIERDNPAYQFEVGEKVAVPRSNGKFSEGRITSEFKDAQGKTNYGMEFSTAEGTGRKVLTKDELHEQYGKFYNNEPAQLRKAEAPKIEAPRPKTPNYAAERPMRIERDNPAYKFEEGEKVVVPRSDGKFTEGHITREFTGKDGKIRYDLEFETPDGIGKKTLSKDEMHSQYARFYENKPAQLLPPAASKKALVEAKEHAEKILDSVQEPAKKMVKDELQSPTFSNTNTPDISLSAVESPIPRAAVETTPLLPAPKKAELLKAEAPHSPAPAPAMAETPRAQSPAKQIENVHAANTLRDINQRAGLEMRELSDKKRNDIALDLKITEKERDYHMEFKVAKSRLEVEGALAKVLPESGVDPKEIRKMLAFGPESGYVTTSEFNQAKKFVEEIQKKGGNEYLRSLKLTNTEIETVNYLIERVPLYANYADASVKPGLKMLERKIVVPKPEAPIAPAQRPSIFEGIKVKK